MTWTYRQSNGELSKDGTFEGNGYSGTAAGRNNPDMQAVQNVGPIPRGSYIIGHWYNDFQKLGPCVMALDALPGTETFGRNLFRIHGDNKNHDASHGCIILGPTLRAMIASSTDRQLDVVE